MAKTSPSFTTNELATLTKVQLHALADALAGGDAAAVARATEFVVAETSGMWHGRARAKMCRRLKHLVVGEAERDRLIEAIVARLRTGRFSEQFRDQLRLVIHLAPGETFAAARGCLASPMPHVRRYAEWVLSHACLAPGADGRPKAWR